MARKVVWTAPAADDLVETIEYIAREVGQAAEQRVEADQGGASDGASPLILVFA